MWYAFLFFIVLLVDQVTKAIAYALYGKSVMIIPKLFGFEAIPLNTGISFGWLADKSWAQPALIAITGVALLVFLIVFLKLPKRKRFLRFSIIMIMTGAAGNLIDRAVEQGVRDFIYMNFGFTEFNNNVADLAVTAGAVMFILALLFVDEDALFRKHKHHGGAGGEIAASAVPAEALPAADDPQDTAQPAEEQDFPQNETAPPAEGQDAPQSDAPPAEGRDAGKDRG